MIFRKRSDIPAIFPFSVFIVSIRAPAPTRQIPLSKGGRLRSRGYPVNACPALAQSIGRRPIQAAERIRSMPESASRVSQSRVRALAVVRDPSGACATLLKDGPTTPM